MHLERWFFSTYFPRRRRRRQMQTWSGIVFFVPFIQSVFSSWTVSHFCMCLRALKVAAIVSIRWKILEDVDYVRNGNLCGSVVNESGGGGWQNWWAIRILLHEKGTHVHLALMENRNDTSGRLDYPGTR